MNSKFDTLPSFGTGIAIILCEMKEKTKILIVESEQIIAVDLQLMLENAGHTIVATATTCEEAIEKVKELKPDIVILDIYLDGEINRKTVTKQIKKISKASVMFYSTCKDIQSIKDVKSVTDDSLADSSRILYNVDEEKQIISNVEKISKITKKQGEVYV